MVEQTIQQTQKGKIDHFLSQFHSIFPLKISSWEVLSHGKIVFARFQLNGKGWKMIFLPLFVENDNATFVWGQETPFAFCFSIMF